MGLKSTTRDKREFRHFARMGDDGSVEIVMATAEGEHVAHAIDRGEDPIDGKLYVEVTDLYPHDFDGVKVKKENVDAKDKDKVYKELKLKNKGTGGKDLGGQ